MTTKVVDSTVSQLLQDNSSVEYVAPEKNPIATVPTETKNLVSSNPCFDFHAEHNGEACIESLKPEDAHTKRIQVHHCHAVCDLQCGRKNYARQHRFIA